MRFRPDRPQTGTTVLLAGWLFADLFLALAIVFLSSSNTSGIKALAFTTPTPTPTQIITPTPTPTPTPVITPTPSPLPRLELSKRTIPLDGIDTNGLLNGTQTAIKDLDQRVSSQVFLRGRAVGLVIAYGGAPDDASIVNAQSVARKVIADLHSLASFSRASYYDPLYTLGDPATTVVIDVYLFAK
jgi:hypothetical protein